MYIVYILYSEKYDSFDIGFTFDMEKRFEQHNSGMTPSTKSKIPWKIAYMEQYETQLEAIRRERFLKAQKNMNFYKRISGIDK